MEYSFLYRHFLLHRVAILKDNRFEIDRFHIGRTICSTLSNSYPNDIIRYSSDGGELLAHVSQSVSHDLHSARDVL